jgi:uncharacterized protein YaaQ
MIVIIRDTDTEAVTRQLVDASFRVTRLNSSGGFLRRGNTTLLIGTEAEKVDQAMQLIRQAAAPPEEPDGRRATVFVLNVAHFEQL